MIKDTLIVNTGGTFNKIYNSSNGLLQINPNNKFIEEILLEFFKSNKIPKIINIINKDSLDIKKKHRKLLLNTIIDSNYKKIIIIHGTDTMSKTAKYLSKKIKNKTIILVGAMIPFSINKIEASCNLAMALGYLKNKNKNNIYICMNGLIKVHNKISKNYKKVVFE